MTKECVQQLLRAGHPSVRVVCMLQPVGAVLQDVSWQLTNSSSSSGGSGNSSAAAVSRAAADITDLQLPLAFQLGADIDVLLNSGQQQAQVVTVVVMAAGRDSKQKPLPHRQQQQQQQQPAVSRRPAATASGGAAAVAPVILEHLPLLLLPAAALTELQQLLPGSASHGSSTKGASQPKPDPSQQQGSWQELLPLVQDFALSLLWCGTQQQPWDSVQAALQASLAAFFEQSNMRHCQQLLQQATVGTGDVAATAAAAAAATPRAAAAPTPAQVTSQQLQQHPQQHQQLQQQQQQQPQDVPAVSSSPKGPSAAAAAATAVDGGGSSSSGGPPPSSRFPAEFYLFTYKIAPCSVTGPHEWST
jgi:hypothetical protein